MFQTSVSKLFECFWEVFVGSRIVLERPMWRFAHLSKCLCASGACLVCLDSLSQARATQEDWEADWVVLTVAQNSAWGSATDATRGVAIAAAIRACRQMAGARGGDCGASITTTRAQWSLAYACGDATFIVTGKTPADAWRSAINEEISLKYFEGVDLAPCALLVAIGPDGHADLKRARDAIASSGW